MDSWFFLSFPPALILLSAGLERDEEPSGEEVLRLIQIRFSDAEFGKNLAKLSNHFAASADRRFRFEKRTHYLIRTHNETLSVVAMRVNNPDRSSLRIKG
jgi:hypothetical protein